MRALIHMYRLTAVSSLILPLALVGCSSADESYDSVDSAQSEKPAPTPTPSTGTAKKDDFGFDKIDFCLRTLKDPNFDETTSNVTFYPSDKDYDKASDARKKNMRLDPNNPDDGLSPDCSKTNEVAFRRCKMKDGAWATLQFTPEQLLSQEGFDPNDPSVKWRKDGRTAFKKEGMHGTSCSSKNTSTGFGGEGLRCGGESDFTTKYSVSMTKGWEGKIEGNIGVPVPGAKIGVGGGITITKGSGTGHDQSYTQKCGGEVTVAGAGCSCATINCAGACELGNVSNLAVMRTCHYSYRITSDSDGSDAAKRQGNKRYGNTAIQVAKVNLIDVVGKVVMEPVKYTQFGCAESEEEAKGKSQAPDGSMVDYCGTKKLECKDPTPDEKKKLDEKKDRLQKKANEYGFLCDPNRPSVVAATGVADPTAVAAAAPSMRTMAYTAPLGAPFFDQRTTVTQELALDAVALAEPVSLTGPSCSTLYDWDSYVEAYGSELLDFRQPFNDIGTENWIDNKRVLTILTGDIDLPVAPLLIKQNPAPSNEFAIDWAGPKKFGGLASTSVKVLPNGGLHIVPAEWAVLTDRPATDDHAIDIAPGASLETILAQMSAVSEVSGQRAFPVTVLALGRTVGALSGISPSLADTLRGAPTRVRLQRSASRLDVVIR